MSVGSRRGRARTVGRVVGLCGLLAVAVVVGVPWVRGNTAAPVPAPVEPRVRIGLATDLDSVTLCCAPQAQTVVDDTTLDLGQPLRIRPAGALAGRASYRLQVAALKDERQAQGIADYLARQTQEPTDTVFDADKDLYRVRYGRFARREDADAAKRRLATLGVDGAWVVSEGGELAAPELLVEQGGRSHRRVGRWLRISAPAGVGIPFQNGRYRASLLLFVNDRGRLNVINELSIEDYLRGVVPREMGPELYNELEALKAQTVAARTFTLRNLGEFRDEGYDLCSTPRCQVYGGMNDEHHRSDRAIRDTAGQVLLVDEAPAEIFYTATCGGHTEDVEVVFPLKRGDHLRGVPCIEARPSRWVGSRRVGDDFPGALMRTLLPPPPGTAKQILAARLEHLVLLAGHRVARDQLAAITRGEVRRYLASALDMSLDPRLLHDADELSRLVAAPPAGWGDRERRFAAYVRDSGLLADPATTPLDGRATEQLLYQLALYLGVLDRQAVTFQALNAHTVEIRHDGSRRALGQAPGAIITYRRQGNGIVRGDLDLLPGDPLVLFRHRDRALAVLRPVEPSPVGFGQRNAKGKWRVTRTPAQLRASVQARYPGFPFRDFQILSRGRSGRVGKLRLLGDGGRSLLVEGLAVRWTLDLSDTWFDVERRADGSMTFDGHGWGHGVGLCQAGAFGMARRGATYREILGHYYTGAQLGRLATSEPTPRTGR